jgi:hypothetical protein
LTPKPSGAALTKHRRFHSKAGGAT